MIKKVNIVVLLVLCILLALPGSAAAYPPDISNHWAEQQIADWVSRGLAGGYQDGSFKPDNLITRAEFMALANRAFSLTSVAPIEFMDVNSTDWHAVEVAKAMAAGYISGYEDNTIRPDNEITREEAAAMLARICKLTTDDFEALNDFVDADSIQWSKAAVASAVARGYMKGYPDQTFQPAKPITRAEAISTMDRAKRGQGNMGGTAAEQMQVNVSGTVPEQEPAPINTAAVIAPKNVDNDPPLFVSYPKLSKVTSTTADLQVKINEHGKAYYVVLNDGSSAPTAHQVRAGQDAKGAILAANLKGSIDLRANVTENAIINGLETSKHYDLYVVAEDAKPNLQFSPAKVEFNTIPPAFVSAETSTDGTEVRITFNKEMAYPYGKHRQFTVLVNGANNRVTGADLGSNDRTIYLYLRNVVLYGQTVTVAYSAGTVTAEDGNVLATFQAKSVKNTAVKPPDAPTGIKASAGNGEVSLSWNAVAGADYKVYQAVSAGGPYTQIASRLDGAEYKVGGLLNGVTYYFVVKASNDGGDSRNSSEVKATPISLPNVPTGLTVSAGNGEVTLNWNAVAGAIGYKVYRSNSSGGPYVQIWGGKETSYKSMGLTNGAIYYYVVRAVNTSGDSERSNEVSATPLNPPEPPAGLTALAGNGQVTLSWNQAARAMAYKVYRSETPGGPYTQISAGETRTSYTATGLTNGRTYYFVVRASNASGDSANSHQAGATPMVLPPNPPTGLTAMAGNGLVTLNWNPVAGAAGYKVYQSSGGPYTQISARETGTTYTVVGLTNGTTYYFVVKANIADIDSADSNEVSATPAVPLPPKAPTGLLAVAGSNLVTLSWNAVAGTTVYKVYQAETPGGPYTQLSAGETRTSYTATGLTNGKTYYFVVKAGNAGGDSENSNEVSATPMVLPPHPPAGLTAMAGNGSVTLNWNPVTGATGYKIYQSSGGPYTQISAVETGTTYTATGLANGTTYYFVVKAGNAGGDSENSNQASATPVGP